jgi:hypothetical protein
MTVTKFAHKSSLTFNVKSNTNRTMYEIIETIFDRIDRFLSYEMISIPSWFKITNYTIPFMKFVQ